MANSSSHEVALVRRVYREAMPVLFLTVLAELLAGALLLKLQFSIHSLIGLFILVPGLMQLRGNISTSLAQRLGSGTHLGIISIKQGLNEPLKANIWAAFCLVIILSFSLGVGAALLTWIPIWLGIVPNPIELGYQILLPAHFIIIALVTALLASLVQVTITVSVALIAHARGLDPDNITIPIVAAVGDILTVVCLLVAVTFALFLIPLPVVS